MPSELRPPAQPAYVLRGHSSQIHAVQFSPTNAFLLTGDADGWVVCWGIAYKRPLAVWRAHENAVLGLAWWNADTIISHGRDSKLAAWDLRPMQRMEFDTMLPIHAQQKELRKPKALYELTLNTLNFCTFATCVDPNPPTLTKTDSRTPILLAVPHILDSEAIDIFQLPSTSRLATIPAPKSPEMGMVMSLAVHTTSGRLIVVGGFESGHAVVWSHSISDLTHAADSSRPNLYNGPWAKIYQTQPHSQPILSLVVSKDFTYFITTSADAIVAKHPLADSPEVLADSVDPPKAVQTKHSGQQGTSMRNDGKVFATAGWDGRVRVYSGKSMREVAVLRWHKDGCYATDFAKVGLSDQLEASRELDKPVSDGSVSKQESGADREVQAIDNHISSEVTSPRGSPSAVASRRVANSLQTHLLAVGAKDGKVSLWDVF